MNSRGITKDRAFKCAAFYIGAVAVSIVGLYVLDVGNVAAILVSSGVGMAFGGFFATRIAWGDW